MDMIPQVIKPLMDVLGEGTTRSGENSRSRLYQCPSCGTVFVAIDKETCFTCQTSVEQITTG
jgi:rubrerythrin